MNVKWIRNKQKKIIMRGMAVGMLTHMNRPRRTHVCGDETGTRRQRQLPLQQQQQQRWWLRHRRRGGAAAEARGSRGAHGASAGRGVTGRTAGRSREWRGGGGVHVSCTRSPGYTRVNASRDGGSGVEDVQDGAEAAATDESGLLARLKRNWLPGAAGDVRVAIVSPAMIPELLSGALFLSLYKLRRQHGEVFLLPTGLDSSFLVVSEPEAARVILRGYPLFEKGLVREVSEFLFGSGFAVAEGELWKSRRRVMLPSLHRAYLRAMVERVFTPCAHTMLRKLDAFVVPKQEAADAGASKNKSMEGGNDAVDMEAMYSKLTLDIIGKSVFNYDFNSLDADESNGNSGNSAGETGNMEVIDAVYDALKETEMRTTDLLPTWKVKGRLGEILRSMDARQLKAKKAVDTIRSTVEKLIKLCRDDVQARGQCSLYDENFVDDADPSILRFLLAAECPPPPGRAENGATPPSTSSSGARGGEADGGAEEEQQDVQQGVDGQEEDLQLRDDLLSLLVAGHETTGAVLTWTTFLLAKNKDKMAKVQEELDAVFGADNTDVEPTIDQIKDLRYLSRCIAESMRLYPHPPVLIRRATDRVRLPGGQVVHKGQDIIVSVYNIHRDAKYWEDPDEFRPERFALDEPVPNEITTDFRYIPFSAGPRKCIGDVFAMLEATVSLAVLLKRLDFSVVEGQNIELTTGATIHAVNGIYMHVTERQTPEIARASTGFPEAEGKAGGELPKAVEGAREPKSLAAEPKYEVDVIRE